MTKLELQQHLGLLEERLKMLVDAANRYPPRSEIEYVSISALIDLYKINRVLLQHLEEKETK